MGIKEHIEGRVKELVDNHKKFFCFWKWDKKDIREIINLIVLTLVVATFFFYKGASVMCEEQGGYLSYYKGDDRYNSFFLGCVPEYCINNSKECFDSRRLYTQDYLVYPNTTSAFRGGLFWEKNIS